MNTNTTVPQALHLLHQVYQNHQKETLGWEIEKTQLKTTIAQLETDLHKSENIRNDLLKRIKMLEFALQKARKGEATDNSSDDDGKIWNFQIQDTLEEKSVKFEIVAQTKKALNDFISKYNALDQSITKDLEQNAPENNRITMLISEDTNIQDLAKKFGAPSGGVLAMDSVEEEEPSNTKVSSELVVDVGLVDLEFDETEEPEVEVVEEIENSSSLWKPKFTLRSHLDNVRCVTFTESLLISSSDDGTVKLWNFNVPLKAKKIGDVEPTITYRGHSGAVMSVCPFNDLIVSGGVDCNLRVWKTATNKSPYEPFDRSLNVSSLIGHTDIIWSIKSNPLLNLVISSSADGTVKLWNPNSEDPLKNTMNFDGIVPSAIEIIQSDPTKLLVALMDGTIKTMDIETCKEVSSYSLEKCFEGSVIVNSIATHHDSKFIAYGLEDHSIRMFSTENNTCVHKMLAHLDSVQSLDIHPSGLSLVSGGHDCSVRFWNLSNYTCTQELSAHRKKFDESIHSVKFHPSKHYLATCGADSIIKFYV